MGMTYPEFYTLFTKVGCKGAEAWRASDLQEQAVGMANAENAMQQADTYYSGFVDRLALLGPALGGTVIVKTEQGLEI